MRRPTCDQRQKHANNQGDSNHDDRDAREAVKSFGDPGPGLMEPPYQETADESDQDDVDDEIYECVFHDDLGSLRIVFSGRRHLLRQRAGLVASPFEQDAS